MATHLPFIGKLASAGLLAALMAGCSIPAPPDDTMSVGRSSRFDIKRPGSVNARAGTDGGLALTCRGLGVARSLTGMPSLGRLASACSSATRL